MEPAWRNFGIGLGVGEMLDADELGGGLFPAEIDAVDPAGGGGGDGGGLGPGFAIGRDADLEGRQPGEFGLLAFVLRILKQFEKEFQVSIKM